MEKAVICDHVSKEYDLYLSVKDKIKGLISKEPNVKKVKVLDNISFELDKGRCFGLVGLNGCGKSTLSSIIAGVNNPTSGNITVNGEVNMLCASSGMKPYLSGLDNIRFKCLLMGYSDKEIKELEQDIIDFADIGIYINQPIKTYSSGMKARLGFSIAVHIDPDILIIDEALSVGDAGFVEKCLEKINAFKDNGKTILLVSHSANVITTFCDEAMWMHKGKMIATGDVTEIIKPYGKFVKQYNAMDIKKKNTYMPTLEEYSI